MEICWDLGYRKNSLRPGAWNPWPHSKLCLVSPTNQSPRRKNRMQFSADTLMGPQADPRERKLLWSRPRLQDLRREEWRVEPLVLQLVRTPAGRTLAPCRQVRFPAQHHSGCWGQVSSQGTFWEHRSVAPARICHSSRDLLTVPWPIHTEE